MKNLLRILISRTAILSALFFIISNKSHATEYETIPAGSYIIDMGVIPQTYENGVQPYGLIYNLITNYSIPIKWVINPVKAKDGVDFVVDGRSFSGAPFIIDAAYRSPLIDSVLLEWENLNVVGYTTLSDVIVPLFKELTFFPIWTLDHQNGKLVEVIFENALIPDSAYNFSYPTDLNCCNDIFVLPHADPEWDTHKKLYTWNASVLEGGCAGWIWSACHGVSALENLSATDDYDNHGDSLMNFLTTNSLVLWGDHDDADPPYVHRYPTDPFMQFMGNIGEALDGGSEQVYLPIKNGDWRSTTRVAIADPDHEDIPSLSNGEAAKVAYGPGFGDSTRGMVMYEGGHEIKKGSEAENVAAQRIFLNFAFLTPAVRRPKLALIPTVPSNLVMASGDSVYLNIVLPPAFDTIPFTYKWTTTCEGSFTTPNDRNTYFISDQTLERTTCQISVKAFDDCGRSSFHSFIITTTPQIPPVANDDTDATPLNTTTTTNVASNDTDADGDLDPTSVSIVLASGPSNGTLTNNGDGTIDYTPNANFSGTDSYDYQICDLTSPTPLCATATVTITVTAIGPIANDDSDATPLNTTTTTNVASNDTDGDGNLDPTSVSFVVASGPSNGTLTNNGDGTIDYTPDANFSGTDSYDYQICDLTSPTPLCATATVTITVTAIGPIANDDSDATPLNTTTTTNVASNDTDGDGNLDPTSVSIVVASRPSNGTLTNNGDGTIDYTPDANFSGTDSYDYQICDLTSPTPLCATATVTITVTAIGPIANDDSDATPLNTTTTTNVASNDTDGDGNLDPTSVSIVLASGPSNGTLTNNGDGTIDYTPNANFSGTDSYDYQICDLTSPTPLCATATVTITVTAIGPIANDDSDATPLNTTTTTNVASNDTDGDGNLDPTSVSIVLASGPSNGTLTNNGDGTIDYTPDANFSGTDSYDYQICDLTSPTPLCATATVTITVTAIGPIANDDSDATPLNTTTTTNVAGNDTDGDGNLDPTSVRIVLASGPSNGTLTNNGDGTIDYTPNANFSGTDSYDYQICDLTSPTPLCATATVTITVTAIGPIANDDSDATSLNTATTTNVASNDTDGDGNLDPTSVSIVVASGPSNGTLTNNGDGTIDYTPNANFSGTDSYDYQICDLTSPTPLCATANVTITVTAIGPIANDDSDATSLNTATTTNVASNDIDGDGNLDPTSVSIVLASEPSNGTLTNNGDGTIDYTPNANFSGTDSYDYQICDLTSPTPLCDVATVTITVSAIGPVANDDADATPLNTTTTTNVAGNDTDGDGNLDPTSVSIVVASGPSNGTLTNNGDGTIDYTPNANFSGTDSYDYQICDLTSPTPLCDVATVTITVSAIGPVANDDTDSTPLNTTTTTNVAGNDTDGDGNLDPTSVSIVLASGPSNGTLTNNGDGTIDYSPNTNFHGTDYFDYIICDNTYPTSLCDTASVTVVVMCDTIFTTIDSTICFEESVVVGTSTYNTSGTKTDTLTNYYGCDSIVTLNLTVLPYALGSSTISICKDGSATINGADLYTATGVYIDTIPGYNCDSIVTLNLTVEEYAASSIDVSICQDETSTINGIDFYGTTGIYVDTIVGSNCDSIVTLSLTVEPYALGSSTQIICQDETATINGVDFYGSTGIYIDTIAGFNCDSIVTLNLTVEPYALGSSTQSICQDETATINGVDFYGNTGVYVDTIAGFNCDSIVTLNLTVEPYALGSSTQSICQDETATINGVAFYGSTGIYVDTIAGFNCDSIVTLNLTVEPYALGSSTQSICQDETATINGVDFYGNTGVYVDTIAGFNCDSIVTLNLTVEPYALGSSTQSICQDETATINGVAFYGSTGIYVDTIAGFNCDSIVTLNLTVVPYALGSSTISICNDASATINGVDLYTTTGVYVDTIPGYNCDSIVTLNLTVEDYAASSINASICQDETATINGVDFYGSTGIYVDTITGFNCDSIVTLNLTVEDYARSSNTEAICDNESFSINGIDFYNSDGIFIDTIPGANCDSIVTLNLTVNPTHAISINEEICDNETFTLPDGSLVDSAGVYEVTLPSNHGCDSVITTTLSINSTYEIAVNEAICDNETFTLPDGSVVSTAGIYPVTLPSVEGCDSIVTTNLTVNSTYAEAQEVAICRESSYTVGVQQFDSTGIYTIELTASNGCDSTITLDLEVKDQFEITLNESICTGEEFIVGNDTFNTSGNYSTDLVASNGCDSVVMLNLTANEIYDISITEEICDNETFTLPDGSLVDSAGIYEVTLPSNYGCDSVITTTLSINPTYEIAVKEAICDNETFTLPDGLVVSTAGIYPVTLPSVEGCDSVITTNLTVNSTYAEAQEVAICTRSSYTVGGQPFDSTGTYTIELTASNGCDSTITLDLEVKDQFEITLNESICTGEEFIVGNDTFNTSGNYSTTLVASNDCDSVIMLNLIVNEIYDISVSEEICDNEAFTLPDGSLIDTAGFYEVTLPSNYGCDSVITTTLSINPTYEIAVNEEICDNETFTLPDGLVVSTAGIYPVTLPSVEGCDSVITTNLTVNSTYAEAQEVAICTRSSYTSRRTTVRFDRNLYNRINSRSNGCDSTITLTLR